MSVGTALLGTTALAAVTAGQLAAPAAADPAPARDHHTAAQKVTGRTYANEVRQRIIEPLHLHDTTAPGTGAHMPQPSSRAYSKLADTTTGPSYDVTEFNPSAAWTSGGMISDSNDLNRIYSALLRGKILPRKQLLEAEFRGP